MMAGKWGNHPSYTDPDVIYAEHMIQASWHLQKAGNAALAEACAVEAAKAFADVEPDRKTGRKRLGLAWYDPVGLMCYDGNVRVSGPAFDAKLEEETPEQAALARRAAVRAFLKTASRKYCGYNRLGWFAKSQLNAALQGRKFKPAGPGMAQVLEQLQKISDTWRGSVDDPVVTAACKDAVAKIMKRDPAAGPACAISSLAHRAGGAWIYKLVWLPEKAIDHAVSRLDAALGGGYEIFADVLENMHGMKFMAIWPQSPYDDVLAKGVNDLKSLAIAGEPAHSHVASLTCRVLEAAMGCGKHVRALCQAYRALSGVPDKESIEMFRSIGALSKDPDFAPSNSLWADVAMLSFRPAQFQYSVTTELMERAMPRLDKTEAAFQAWLSDGDMLESLVPDQAMFEYDIPEPDQNNKKGS